MGFFSSLFGGGIDHGDAMVFASLQHVMLDELNTAGWLKTPRTVFRTRDSDNGFFRDIYRVFANNPMYAMLKSEDPHAYLMSVASTSMIAGLCAVELALNRRRPLYGAYRQCLQTFMNVPPLETLHQLYDDKVGGPCISDYALSQLIDNSCEKGLSPDESSYCEGAQLRAVASAFYEMGQTMGYFYN